MDKIWHTTHLCLTPPIQEYAKKLSEKLPEHLSVILRCKIWSPEPQILVSSARSGEPVVFSGTSYIVGAVGDSCLQHNNIQHTAITEGMAALKNRFAMEVRIALNSFQVCFFANSGSEANDMALLLAKLYTGNYDVISLRWRTRRCFISN